MLPVLILGAGGHAKVIIESLDKDNHKILGIMTPDLAKGTDYLGIQVIGNDENIFAFNNKDILLVNGIGSLPGKSKRWDLAYVLREKGYRFSSVIHPNTIISPDIDLSEGVQIMAGTIIQPGCKIGQDTIVNTGSQIDHDTFIGSNCHISPGVIICGEARVGDNVHIGTGSTVIQGVSIGKDSIIAAGTTVYKDVPSCMKVRQETKIIFKDNGSW